jgi:hypothetical protein
LDIGTVALSAIAWYLTLFSTVNIDSRRLQIR